jgi:hypothetical protein
MSSVRRSSGEKKEGLTRFVKPESPSYDEVFEGPTRLFPFTYNNGVLDISYDGNSFQERMVDISGSEPQDETSYSVRIMGGPRLVTSLGNNFKTYIRSWRYDTIDSGSPIEINIPSQVVKVQEADRANTDASSGNSYKISVRSPTGDNYVTGNTLNKFCTTYIFKTPMTFTIKEGGVTKYITFRTIFDQEG